MAKFNINGAERYSLPIEFNRVSDFLNNKCVYVHKIYDVCNIYRHMCVCIYIRCVCIYIRESEQMELNW